MWGRILDFVVKYGTKAVQWAWTNRLFLLSLGDTVFKYISKFWG